jgi:hypothetical protein
VTQAVFGIAQQHVALPRHFGMLVERRQPLAQQGDQFPRLLGLPVGLCQPRGERCGGEERVSVHGIQPRCQQRHPDQDHRQHEA